jgi:hypothetical protein
MNSRLTDSDFFVGPYGFVLEDVQPLPFKPCKGQLGIFEESPLEIRGLEGVHRKQGLLLGRLRVVIAVVITTVWLIVAAVDFLC